MCNTDLIRLPALEFHHTDPKLKSEEKISLYRNWEKTRQKLKKDNCVSLCGNCHRMEQSTHFKYNYEEIVKPEYWNQIREDYEMTEKNLREFKFTGEKE